MNPPSTDWNYGYSENTYRDEFCSKEYYCEVDWSNPLSIHNIIEQYDLYCAPKVYIGAIGFVFLLGIVIGCLTLTRFGDIYGRKPVYMLGLLMNAGICLEMTLSSNFWVTSVFLLMLGMSITTRYYVGYSYNVEM